MNFQKAFFDELEKAAQGFAPPAMYGGFKPAGMPSKGTGLLAKLKQAVRLKRPAAIKKPMKLR